MSYLALLNRIRPLKRAIRESRPAHLSNRLPRWGALFACLALLMPAAYAAIPQTINYQGNLTTSAGAPVSGPVAMTFRIYNAASGGTALYTETQLGIGVSNGSFNAIIGAKSPLALPFDVPYWLTVSINADEEMSPRQPLSAAAYALRAITADALASGATIAATQLSGTISSSQFAATQLLPTIACAIDQIPKWNGATWVCSTGGVGTIGPTGPTGPIGPQGIQGLTGLTGAAGATGATGAQGSQGPAGPNNITGNLTMLNSTAASGNVLKAGERFIHNFGDQNTFVGLRSGNFSMTGIQNTAVGTDALLSNDTGNGNVALGLSSLASNRIGESNTAIGTFALIGSVSGARNTAVGYGAHSVFNSMGNNNTSLGYQAGSALGTGSNFNILVGHSGTNSDSGIIRIGTGGTHGKAFVAGISGVTPTLPTLPVVIDSNGQLGTGTATVGGVTSVATGSGLTGGPITASGTINLASTQLLPVAACATDQIPKWNGAAWVCSTGGGGTIGPTGPIGPIGPQGIQGLTGLTGAPGTPGATGLPGPAGTAGAVGAQGLPGLAGATGAIGPQGPAGPNNITGNLTIVPSTANTGNILKDVGGQLLPFIHNFGIENTFIGLQSGNFTMTGGGNTATGRGALAGNMTGSGNTASGSNALAINDAGSFNTASGESALSRNTTGNNNNAIGAFALNNNSTGSGNIALGGQAGVATTGSNNIAIGNQGVAGESNTIRIGGGTHAKSFIGGIRGVAPDGASPLPVVIDVNGQLGTGAVAVSGVTGVATGAGLTGGPITTTGTISLAGTQLLPTSACAANQVAKWNGSAWTCATDNDSNSGGTVTSITAGGGLTGGTITGVGTIAIDPMSNVLSNNFFKFGGNFFNVDTVATLGSITPVPVDIIANGVRAARFAPTADGPNIALGHPLNVAGGVNVQAATVGGGGIAQFPNLATATYATVAGGVNNKAQVEAATVGGGNRNTAGNSSSTVAGGESNTASGAYSTVAGGLNNTASGTTSTVGGGVNNTSNQSSSTVGGGQFNTASGQISTVAGGSTNTAANQNSTVGGGQLNTASGFAATVPGGFGNTALGDYSFAAGRRAKASSQGCFVWGDSTNADINCTFVNAFAVRASGGVYLRSSADLSTGCDIPAGGGAWACTSARETKKDFTAMNPVDVLKRVVGLPVTQWRYRTEESGARHVGPMAEDFHAAFGLGDSVKTISVLDASGIAFAAIQGLNQLVVKKDVEIQTQNKRIKMLEDALAAIQSRLGMR